MGLWSHSGAVPVLWDLRVLLFTWNWGSQLQNQGSVCPQSQQHPLQCGVQAGALVSFGLCCSNCPRSIPVLEPLCFRKQFKIDVNLVIWKPLLHCEVFEVLQNSLKCNLK